MPHNAKAQYLRTHHLKAPDRRVVINPDVPRVWTGTRVGSHLPIAVALGAALVGPVGAEDAGEVAQVFLLDLGVAGILAKEREILAALLLDLSGVRASPRCRRRSGLGEPVGPPRHVIHRMAWLRPLGVVMKQSPAAVFLQHRAVIGPADGLASAHSEKTMPAGAYPPSS